MAKILNPESGVFSQQRAKAWCQLMSLSWSGLWRDPKFNVGMYPGAWTGSWLSLSALYKVTCQWRNMSGGAGWHHYWSRLRPEVQILSAFSPCVTPWSQILLDGRFLTVNYCIVFIKIVALYYTRSFIAFHMYEPIDHLLEWWRLHGSQCLTDNLLTKI